MNIFKTAINAAVMVVSGKIASDGFEKAKAKLKERKERKDAEFEEQQGPIGSVTQAEVEPDDAE